MSLGKLMINLYVIYKLIIIADEHIVQPHNKRERVETNYVVSSSVKASSKPILILLNLSIDKVIIPLSEGSCVFSRCSFRLVIFVYEQY